MSELQTRDFDGIGGFKAASRGVRCQFSFRNLFCVGLTVSAGVLNSPTELIMSDPIATDAADNIPVSLDFDLGSLALPLGELAVLKPGYVFELAGSLEKLRVVIRANGTRVGLGELVAVGDVLGVQLLALEIDGLR